MEHKDESWKSLPSSGSELGSFSQRVEMIVSMIGGVPALSRKSGLSDAVIRKWLAGQSDPSRSNLVKLADAAGVRVEWLATGRGPTSYVDDYADEIGNRNAILDDRTKRFAERLQSIIGHESVRSFAQRAGVNEGSLRNMLRGGLPRLDTLVAIADEAGVDVGWLATGKSPKALDEHKKVAEDPGEYALSDFAVVPIYDVEASCGHGAWNSPENAISTLAFRRDWLKHEGLDPSRLAAIRARGDSMEPTIQSGDTLLVDLRANTPRSDGIYIIEQDGGLSAKRIQRAPDGSLYIRSDNPAYQTFSLGPDATINVIGRLAWIGRRIL